MRAARSDVIDWCPGRALAVFTISSHFAGQPLLEGDCTPYRVVGTVQQYWHENKFYFIPILTGTLYLVLTDTRTTCLTSATNRNALGSDVHPTRSQCPEIHACHTFHSNDSDELFVSMGQ